MGKRRRNKTDEKFQPRKSKSRTVAKLEAENETFFPLPDEVLLLIFSFIPFRWRGSVAQVSRRFNRVVLDWTLWKWIPVSAPYIKPQQQTVYYLTLLFGERFKPALEAIMPDFTQEKLKDAIRPKLTNHSRRSIVAFVRRVCKKICGYCGKHTTGRLKLYWSGKRYCDVCKDDVACELISVSNAKSLYGCTASQFNACETFVVNSRMSTKTRKCRTKDVFAQKAKTLETNEFGDVYWSCHNSNCKEKHGIGYNFVKYDNVVFCDKMFQRQQKVIARNDFPAKRTEANVARMTKLLLHLAREKTCQNKTSEAVLNA
jgi:hypothetical protein